MSASLLFMRWMPGTIVLSYQVLNLFVFESGIICLCKNFVIMCLYAPAVCSACCMLVRLVASLASLSAFSLPSIFMWLGTQLRIVRLPRWLRLKAEFIILVVISGYVCVFVCARILMAAIESECMIVSSCLSCASRHARAACMACSSARVTGV